jgi:hypothetical protein
MATKKNAAKKKVGKGGSKAKSGTRRKRSKSIKRKAATGTPITVGGDG